MNDFDKIEELWEAGDKEVLSNEKMDIKFLKEIMLKQSQGISSNIIKLIRKNIFIALAVLVISLYNISFYYENIKIFIFIITSFILMIITFFPAQEDGRYTRPQLPDRCTFFSIESAP